MNVISTRMHAWLDYPVGLLAAFSPLIFLPTDSGVGSWVLVGAGVAILTMSLFTNYEGGMVRSLPMSAHLTIDIFMGAFVAASPWLFGFADRGYIFHLVIGAFIVLTTVLTSRKPFQTGGTSRAEQLENATPVDSKFTKH